MPLSTTEKFRCINQESSDIYNSGISFDPMNSFSCLPYEGMQSPGYELQFRHRQGAFVPVRPKQAMSNSSSEVPSSSSVSVYSDETEHTGDHPQLKVGLYKTELCRSWEETGFCRYGAKCQVCSDKCGQCVSSSYGIAMMVEWVQYISLHACSV